MCNRILKAVRLTPVSRPNKLSDGKRIKTTVLMVAAQEHQRKKQKRMLLMRASSTPRTRVGGSSNEAAIRIKRIKMTRTAVMRKPTNP